MFGYLEKKKYPVKTKICTQNLEKGVDYQAVLIAEWHNATRPGPGPGRTDCPVANTVAGKSIDTCIVGYRRKRGGRCGGDGGEECWMREGWK